MDLYQKFIEAERRLNEGLIRLDVSLVRPEGVGAHPKERMTTMARFLDQLGHPQRGIPAVHVAGTSGKGSVSAHITGILQRAGLRVGLHISPYLQSSTEKIQIDGQLLDAETFISLVNWAMPVARQFHAPATPASIHGMTSVAIAFEAFRRAKVDVIVCEAGCGARFDLTNFLDTEVSVLTNVGLDHLHSLGPTIEDIAWHKAGVARTGKPLITGARGSALNIIRREAATIGATLIEIPTLKQGPEHNVQMAIAAAAGMLDALKVKYSTASLQSGLKDIQLPARMECLPQNEPTVYLDGAHNEDKLGVAIPAITAHIPDGRHIVALVGFLGSKGSAALVQPFVGRVHRAVATEPRVLGKPAFPAAHTQQLFQNAGIPAESVLNPFDALERAIALAGPSGAVIIAGSFYLAGELRSRWYTDEQVVLQQTSWPTLRK